MRRCLIISLLALVVLSARAQAQTCVGLASYSEGPLQVTGTGSVTSEARSVGAGFGYGRPASGFGSLAIGTTSNDGLGGSSLELGASAGYEIPLGKAAAVHLCPIASFDLGIGPKNTFDSGVDRSSKAASVGFALGTSFLAGPRMKVIPTIGLAYAYRHDQAENEAGARLFEISQGYGFGQLGVGFVLNDNISVRPSIEVPLGLEGSDPTLGLTVGYNFGSSRNSTPQP